MVLMKVLVVLTQMLLIMIHLRLLMMDLVSFFGCTDSTAENYDFNATNDDGSCEYFCDNFIIQTPVCNSPIQAQYGEYVVINCDGDNLIFLDENENILSAGSGMYITNPIYENTIFSVINESVVESSTSNIGEPQHEGEGPNGDYSSTVYNGGLLFNCYSTFTLNSVKVYTDSPGERTIELRDNSESLVAELVVNIPQTGDDGYVVNLGWDIEPGNQYILTTNTQMNNDIFGDNNPMLKRTTGGLPDFPFIINNVLEITEGYYTQGAGDFGSSQDYYYYFYDWQINYDKSCQSDPVMIYVNLDNSSLAEEYSTKSLIKVFDVLGRENTNKNFNIELYDDGTVEKQIILK
jgi:hypothetical protein